MTISSPKLARATPVAPVNKPLISKLQFAHTSHSRHTQDARRAGENTPKCNLATPATSRSTAEEQRDLFGRRPNCRRAQYKAKSSKSGEPQPEAARRGAPAGAAPKYARRRQKDTKSEHRRDTASRGGPAPKNARRGALGHTRGRLATGCGALSYLL